MGGARVLSLCVIVNSIPVVVGASIATIVTNTVAPLRHFAGYQEFKRAVNSTTGQDSLILNMLLLFPSDFAMRCVEYINAQIANRAKPRKNC